MRRYFVRYGLPVLMAAGLVWLGPIGAAQDEGGAPAPKAAKKEQNVPTPRMPDGKPDLSGRWGGGGGEQQLKVRLPDGKEQTFDNFEAYDEALAQGKVDPKAIVVGRQTGYRHGNNDYSGKDEALTPRYFGNPPIYKPEYWAKVQDLDLNGNNTDPALWTCLPGGVPRMGPPVRIFQTDKDVTFLYGNNNFMNNHGWRVIPTDGRPHHPVYSKEATYKGDSVGKWEGDTLVVDVVGLTDETWLGWPGWLHSNNARVVEKFRRDGNQLNYDVTVYDPDVLMEPWEMDHRVIRINPSSLYPEEPPCVELDHQHIVSRLR